MEKNLTDSYLDRKNVLNNELAIKEIESTYQLAGVSFNGSHYFVNQQIANFYEVDIRTIERLIEDHKEELESNDYEVIKGEKLAAFKKAINESELTDINVGQTARNLGIATFRTVLNFAMLLKNSNKAQETRSRILDIVVDIMTNKTDNNIKYINQRDAGYLDQAFIESSERKKFTNSLKNYINMGQYKYAYFTDLVYKSIFKENTKEYRNVLSLARKDQTRETMYSEVLLVIASYEAGIAYELEIESDKLGRQLTKDEAERIVTVFSNHPAQRPHLNEVRMKMASRDLGLRDVYHEKLNEYIQPISEADFEKFIGEQSKSLEKQLEEHIDVFNRLKDK